MHALIWFYFFAVLCWAFLIVDLVSAIRVIEHLDYKYTMLSVKELCYFASPKERSLHMGEHKCHPLSAMDGLEYIKKYGVGIHYGKQEFDCKNDAPRKKGNEMIRIKGALFLGNNLKKASLLFNQLVQQ